MSVRRLIPLCLLSVLLSACFQPLHAQTGFDLTIKKPEPYEERQLKAEKTPQDKKIKEPKKFFQNLTTHYNYFFNAKNKLNEVIERAKTAHQDDYTQLLSFYNYDLDATARDESQLDSVKYKSQTGIVMHDLRNDWIDNLYLLWGASYYLQKKFDSAAQMFQFINYAFAPKDEDGYYKYIGSPAEGQQTLTIATKEGGKGLGASPSRNDALVWMTRTFMEDGRMAEAGSLITTLKGDPVFPKRLNPALEEVQALWFYKQGMWDSSAVHLVKALDQALTKHERGRWEFLAAQMFAMSKNTDEAVKYFTRSISHTTDPVMDVYARLNLVRLNREGGENYIDKNVAELLKMAKRDRYSEYRDVIYFMAAQIELERGNLAAAQELMLKGAKYNSGNVASRSKAYLQIANLSFEQKKYVQAAKFYDSVMINELQEKEALLVDARKPVLTRVVFNMDVINRQDSLQRVAAMPEDERTVFITKLAKQLRKQQGLAEENVPSAGNPAAPTTSSPTLFDQQKGEWYFYNSTLKAQGQAQFKSIWGNRPNVDNWRRFADVSSQLAAKLPPQTGGAQTTTAPVDALDNTPSYKSLLAKLPMTPEALNASNDSIRNALYNLGVIYTNELQDYPSAIEVLEALRTRFPSDGKMDEVLFQLYYAYSKAGNLTKAAEIKQLLTSRYSGSRYATIATTGKDPASTSAKSPEATRAYEAVYDQFISGHFEEAEAAKRRADSTYKTNYWQPQLLYIEAVYQIRQQQDSVARGTLQTLIAQDPNTPLAKKAQNLLQVLSRRKQIEEELTRYQLQRPGEDTAARQAPVVQTTPKPQPVIKKDTATSVQPPVVVQKPEPKGTDTVTVVKKPVQDTVAVVKKPAADTVAVVKKPVPDTVAVKPVDLAVKKPLDTISVKKVADTIAKRPVDIAVKKPVDSVAKKPAAKPVPYSIFTYDPAAQHYAVVVLNKVDVVFTNEAKTAFQRYNRERYYNQPLDVQLVDLNADNKLLLIGGFANLQAAMDYALTARSQAANDIIPWLKSDRYSFTILSAPNLEVLKANPDLTPYRKFLEQNLPGKF